MREIALGRVIDDVLEGGIDRLRPKLDRIDLVRVGGHFVEDRRVDLRRLIADEAGERCPLCPMAFSGGAQAAVKMNLESRCLIELRRGQFNCPLIEVVGNPHRADRMGRGRPGTDLVELVRQGHHWTLRLLHHVQVRIEPDGLRICRRLSEQRIDLATKRGDCRSHSAAHHECSAVRAGGGIGEIQPRQRDAHVRCLFDSHRFTPLRRVGTLDEGSANSKP